MNKFYSDPDFEFEIKKGEPAYLANDGSGRKIPEWVIYSYERELGLLQNLSADVKFKENQLISALEGGLKEKMFSGAVLNQFINKDFNDLTSFGDKFWRSGVGTIMKTLYGATGTVGMNALMREMGINSIDDWMIGWDQWNQKRDATFARPLDLDEVDGIGSFGAWSANFISQNWAPVALALSLIHI